MSQTNSNNHRSPTETHALLLPTKPLPKRFLKSWPRVFADKGMLIDDLSFSYYFHSQDSNQFLHLTSILLIFFSLAIALAFVWAPAGVPVVGIAFFVVYASIMITMEYVSGLAYAAWFAASLTAAPFFLQFGQSAWIPALVAVVVLPLMQLVGHVCIERRLPAFRLFEATLTTPLFLMIRALSLFGAFPVVMAEIKKRSARWNSWPQRTFGDAVVPSTGVEHAADLIADATLVAKHDNRDTVLSKDIMLARRIRGERV
jgi:uncharacterized membrane protein YGL010W